MHLVPVRAFVVLATVAAVLGGARTESPAAPVSPVAWSAPAQPRRVCETAILRSPYSYAGSAGTFTSGQFGLPTFGTAGSDFPDATAGVIVPAGDNEALISQGALSAANTVYYAAPGLHTTGGHPIFGGNRSAYVGGYANGNKAVFDGGGLAGGKGNFMQPAGAAEGVTLRYLQVRDYLSSQNSAVVIGRDGWTFANDTIGPNEFGYPNGAGQNNGGGYAILAGSRTTIADSCLTRNAQGGFNLPGGTGAYNQPPTVLVGIVIRDSEISYNGLGEYPDVPGNPLACGCSGGGKIFWSRNAKFTGNYVHDNYAEGVWFDFNNTGAEISGNYVASNWQWGIYYEASYNAAIRNNTVIGNGWASHGAWPRSRYCDAFDPVHQCADGAGPTGEYFGNVSAGGITIPDSGGNAVVKNTAYSGRLTITRNTVTDNWSGVDVYQDDTRFAGGVAQCNSPLLGLDPTYRQQWQQAVANDVMVTGPTLTSAGGFVAPFQNGTAGQSNYCGTPGPLTTPRPGWRVFDTAGAIPAGDTISRCSSANSCALSTPATAPASSDTVYVSRPGGCGYADLIGSSEGTPSGSPSAYYWDNCLWATRNVSVTDNRFTTHSDAVTDCTAAALCGVNAIIDAGQGFPAEQFNVYNGTGRYFTTHAPDATSPLAIVFGGNSYAWSGTDGSGGWQFEAGPQGSAGNVSPSEWTQRYHQDQGSTGLG